MSEFRHERRIGATPEQIYLCVEDPRLLTQWWGPEGFSNTFETFDFRPDGLWKFVMHGPDGTNYPNECRFVELGKPNRFVVRHVVAPLFTGTLTLEPVAGGSLVTWVQAFDDPEVAQAVAPVVEPSNEQLLDKLQRLAEGHAAEGRPSNVNFQQVSTQGLETSPVADALAGLRANEARYFHTKYQHRFETRPAAEVPELVGYVNRILLKERGLTLASPPLEATQFEAGGILWTYVFYQSGLSINVLYTLEDQGKRAVGFKLSQGMEVPAELAPKFKFARQKSKLAGEIRGSFFVIKGRYE